MHLIQEFSDLDVCLAQAMILLLVLILPVLPQVHLITELGIQSRDTLCEDLTLGIVV